MISLKKNNKGFTIVELLIVLIVIGILILLVLTTYSGIRAKSRNVSRQNDIDAISTQLESFYSQNGYYPSLADMNSQSWLNANMKLLNQNALVDPSSTTSSKMLADKPTKDEYSYEVSASNGLSCEKQDTNCAQYTLTAEYEGSVNGSNTYTKSNLD
jgi:prepilin-type N-terminal cleavage/methylation domain-containing protein